MVIQRMITQKKQKESFGVSSYILAREREREKRKQNENGGK